MLEKDVTKDSNELLENLYQKYKSGQKPVSNIVQKELGSDNGWYKELIKHCYKNNYIDGIVVLENSRDFIFEAPDLVISSEGIKYLESLKNSNNATEDIPITNDNPAFWIVFDDLNKRVILNDIFILSEVKANSDAHNLIEALIKTPNKKLTADKINVSNLHQSLSALGFVKVLKKLFIESGKGQVKLINPVTHERLGNLSEKELIRISFAKDQ